MADPTETANRRPTFMEVAEAMERLMRIKSGELSRNEEILIHRAAGETYREIGQRFGVSTERARQICAAFGKWDSANAE